MEFQPLKIKEKDSRDFCVWNVEKTKWTVPKGNYMPRCLLAWSDFHNNIKGIYVTFWGNSQHNLSLN